MSERFAKKWESKREVRTYGDVLRESQQPLKQRLDFAVKRLELQINKLDQTNDRFAQKDNALFAKIVNAYTKHDTARANMYAKELSEIRKIAKLVMNARLALDQVALRIKTVTELGDIVATLGPAIGVLRNVNVGVSGVLPEAENELGEIGNMLSGIMIEAGQSSGMTLNFGSVNEGAEKILSEAAAVAEQKINSNFPDLPQGIPSTANKSRT